MKNILEQVIILLLIVMFSYAAISKLLDYDISLLQLKKSEFLTRFAEFISWSIPGLELLTCTFLIIPKWRLAGLYCSFGLMLLFTGYIIMILNFAEQVPCSCGGILEHMSWKQHLIFNIVFLLLTIYATLNFLGSNQEASRTPVK